MLLLLCIFLRSDLIMEANSSMSRKHHLIEYANGPSLEEINGTVEVPKGKGFLKTLFMYSGPGAIILFGIDI